MVWEGERDTERIKQTYRYIKDSALSSVRSRQLTQRERKNNKKRRKKWDQDDFLLLWVRLIRSFFHREVNLVEYRHPYLSLWVSIEDDRVVSRARLSKSLESSTSTKLRIGSGQLLMRFSICYDDDDDDDQSVSYWLSASVKHSFRSRTSSKHSKSIFLGYNVRCDLIRMIVVHLLFSFSAILHLISLFDDWIDRLELFSLQIHRRDLDEYVLDFLFVSVARKEKKMTMMRRITKPFVRMWPNKDTTACLSSPFPLSPSASIFTSSFQSLSKFLEDVTGHLHSM